MRGKNGFSLIEALIAAAILLLICLSVSGTVLATMRAEAVLDRRALLEQLVEAERVRLAALPYVRRVAAPTSGTEWLASEKSLVGEVFPHGRPQHNTADASLGEDEEGPLFVTRYGRDGVAIERTARFIRRDPSGWACLSAAELSQWAVWESPPPATSLQVTLVATQDGRSATRLMRVTAPAPILPLVTGADSAVSP